MRLYVVCSINKSVLEIPGALRVHTKPVFLCLTTQAGEGEDYYIVITQLDDIDVTALTLQKRNKTTIISIPKTTDTHPQNITIPYEKYHVIRTWERTCGAPGSNKLW